MCALNTRHHWWKMYTVRLISGVLKEQHAFIPLIHTDTRKSIEMHLKWIIHVDISLHFDPNGMILLYIV